MIHQDRIHQLNINGLQDGNYILYWMQQAQRVSFNHALEYAIDLANKNKLPLLVCFVITDNFPEANLRHYQFMLEGLQQIKNTLNQRQISFVLKHGNISNEVAKLAKKASLLVTDYGYLRIQRLWRQELANTVQCPCIAVESDIIVPVEAASNKEEIGARTLRTKINKIRSQYLTDVPQLVLRNQTAIPLSNDLNIGDLEITVNSLEVDKSIPPSPIFKGGYLSAIKWLDCFIDKYLTTYATDARDPVAQCQSNLSPYLHFGQISPLEVALKVLSANADNDAKEAFLEELIVRRELSINFCYYNTQYDSYQGAVPSWAQQTLQDHTGDERPYCYDLETLEQGATHDQYWNAAQQEMLITGKMHNYMRMYWGKKIIEWTKSPEDAFNIALYLNNKYQLDGRDPNAFTGIAWCFGKHDHPWQERLIFGKNRYMNAQGLERKFQIKNYVAKIAATKRSIKSS